MQTTFRATAAALAICSLFIAGAARADALRGDFDINNGAGASSSGGEVTFQLQSDGTILAALHATAAIVGFGFDSGSAYAESGFSSAVSNSYGWSDMYGSQASGFACNTGCGTDISWTIGAAGQFSSAAQALAGTNSRHDFFLYTGGNQWAADSVAYAPAAPVPEPSTGLLVLGGLGVVGLLARRRQAAPAR